MKFLRLLAIVCLPAIGNAQQPFSVAFALNADVGRHNLVATYDHGAVFCYDAPLQPPMDNSEGYLVKLDSTGAQEWVKSFKKSNWATGIIDGNTVVQTQDSGFAIGTTWFRRDSTTFDFVLFARLIKTDMQGNVQWSMLYPGEGRSIFMDMEQTADHGFIACGKTQDTVIGSQWKGFLVKADSLGNIEWGKTYSGAPVVELNTVIQSSTGEYVAGGRFSGDGFLIKVGSTGTLQWSQRCSNSYMQNDVKETSLGGFITIGQDMSLSFTTLYQFDVFGTPMWAKRYRAGQKFVASQLVPVANGYTMISNSTSGGKVSMGQIDLNGNTVWSRMYLDVNGFVEPAIVRTHDGGYMFTASRDDGTSATDRSIVVTKTDSLGVAFCNDSILSDSSVMIPVALPLTITSGDADTSLTIVTTTTSTLLIPSPVCVITGQHMESTSQEAMQVYPNPTNGRVTIQTSFFADQTRIRLCDISGRTVFEDELLSDRQDIDLSTLQPGMYFLLLERNGATIAQKPVIRNQ